MSQVYHDGYLHTNSAYFSEVPAFRQEDYKQTFNADKLKQDYEDAIRYAEEQERRVYQTFFKDVTTYEEFISELRKLFNNANNVGEKIKRLSNASLKSDIYIPGSKEKVNFRIEITKDVFASITFKDIRKEDIIIEGDTLFLSLDNTADVGIMKEIVNFIKKIPDDKWDKYEPFNRAHLYHTGTFKPGSPDIGALERWLQDELDASSDEFEKQLIKGVTLTKDKPQQNETTTKVIGQRIQADKLAFNKFTKKEIDNAIKSGDKEVIKLIDQARADVKDFLMNRLDVNSDELLQKAFNLSWSKLPTNYVFEGDNLIKSVLGNLGEFQTDLAINYATFASKDANATALLSGIIGDITQGKRGQPRSDYQILTAIGEKPVAIGAQVKNVDKSKYNDIEVNTDLGLIAPNLGDNITTSIANYKFNASIAAEVGNMERVLKDYLSKFIWRGLNFNVRDGLIEEHTNTFYILGGTQIIPVSHIIRRLANPKGISAEYKATKLMDKPETTISGLTKGSITDEGYEAGRPPLFIKYWERDGSSWIPQSSNQDEFQNLLGGIRVKSILKFASFLQVSGGNKGYYEMF